MLLTYCAVGNGNTLLQEVLSPDQIAESDGCNEGDNFAEGPVRETRRFRPCFGDGTDPFATAVPFWKGENLIK